MLVLGIETSCDETAVALVTDEKKILIQKIWSQHEHHQAHGGIVPELAARAHVQKIGSILNPQLADSLNTLTAIAATAGPGLMGGLIVGLTFAKTLAALYQVPLIGVNHLAGHILSPRLQEDVAFPYLCLLASGGHTQLVLVRGLNNVQILGQTLDDAAGEAFDKGAKILDLGFPGGPALEKAAQNGDPTRFPFTQPLQRRRRSLDFSFSGLKTALLRQKAKIGSLQGRADLAASYEQVIVSFLAQRLLDGFTFCVQEHKITPTALALVGGVGANEKLRQQLLKNPPAPVIILDKSLCTDNAAMISWAAIEKLMCDGMPCDATASLLAVPRPRWPLEDGFYSDASAT